VSESRSVMSSLRLGETVTWLVPQIVEAGLFVETRDDDATVELLVRGQRAVDIDLRRCVIKLPIFQDAEPPNSSSGCLETSTKVPATKLWP